MHRSQRFGYLVCLLLSLFLFSSLRLMGQNPAGSQAAASQQQTESPEEDQIRLAQEAQARIRARRQARMEQAIRDTYSHRYEVYGGSGYLRFRPGKSLQQMNEGAWNVGFTRYFRPLWGFTADLRGYYGSAYVGLNSYNIFQPSISEYSFMLGPQYRILQRERWGISGQVLAGASKGIFNGDSAAFPGTLLGMWKNGTTFAWSLGMPIDYNVSPGLAIRIMPDYWWTNFSPVPQIKNLGVTGGLVYRFGRQ